MANRICVQILVKYVCTSLEIHYICIGPKLLGYVCTFLVEMSVQTYFKVKTELIEKMVSGEQCRISLQSVPHIKYHIISGGGTLIRSVFNALSMTKSHCRQHSFDVGVWSNGGA